MKHLYWIICGVIILALLAAWFLVVPTDEARQAKQDLDKRSLDLKDLEKRANTPLTGVFDAVDPADTQRLAKDYLITERWKSVLQPHVEKYQNQLDAMKKQLLGRKAWLHRPVSQTNSVLEWYNAYVESSEALIAKLKTAGCLQLATTAKAAQAQAATPGGGEPATVVSPTEAVSNESPAEVRTAVGLYTKVTAFPEPKEHPVLTARLRIMELISERLIASRIAVADNPLNPATGRSEDRASASATIVKVSWDGTSGTGEQIGRTVKTVISDQVAVESIDLHIELEGPLSALLAASGNLERNTDADRPLIAITSANLARRADYAAGDRFDVASEPVRLELTLSILEFIEPSEAAPVQDPAGMGMGMGGPGMGFAPAGMAPEPAPAPRPRRNRTAPRAEE